jgi:PAS domain S-box-containing protein
MASDQITPRKRLGLIPPFRDWKIRAKLISITLLLVFLPLLTVSHLSMDRFDDALRNAAEEDLQHLVRNIYAMCKAQQEMVQGQDGRLGAYGVRVSEESTRSLKNEIKQIKVGSTGYVYIMDSRGVLRIHPAKEGEDILDSKDSSGFEYIRAMIAEAKRIPEGAVGTIRYPWMNPELGEKRPRQKITKFIYFQPWDWIIAAGTYEEEIYRSLYETERFIIIVVVVSLALVLGLTVALSKVLTLPIQELTGATTKMLGGDFSQRVRVHSTDEFGALGNSFNRMATQIQEYTANLERMVEERTRELTESRERYRDLSRFLNSILESATAYAIIAIDFYGKIIEFNTGAERLFGWRREEVFDRENIAITILSEDRERGIQREMSRRTRSEGVCELEMNRLRKDGTTFPAQSTVTAIIDPSGRVSGFVEIVRDLTRRRTLERELRKTKEFLENILESSVDGIVTTDLKGHITYMNLGMEMMLGYRREEVLGTHISNLYVRGIDEARDLMGRLRTAERTQNYEMQVKTKEGDILSIMTSASLLRDGEGNLIGTSGIFKDITEQKRLEAKLKETQFHLVEASKMRALGELVSGVAHELNNPLMASQTILHVIVNNLHEGCPNRDRLELIRKCNDRIEKIVDHLREFSRQTKPDFREIDINQPIENALMITGQQLLDHNITIVRQLTDGLPRIHGDPNQLEQVFLNLISNARDALDEVTGHRELTIRTCLTTEVGRPFVAASIKDTGVGIPDENRDKVLEPFFTTKTVGRGTGLGLPLCFGIVEAHGGRLEIKSDIGEGTEIRVSLPINEKRKGAENGESNPHRR